MARLSETFSKAHEVMDAEKNVVLGKRSLLHSLPPQNVTWKKKPKTVVKSCQHVSSPGLSQPILDIYDSPVYRTNLERMQGFFTTLYDNW